MARPEIDRATHLAATGDPSWTTAVAASRGAHARRSRAQRERSASVRRGQGRFFRFYLVLFGADALLGWLAWTMARPITHGLEYPVWSLRGAVASALSDIVVSGGLLTLVAFRGVHHERRRFADPGLRGPKGGRKFGRDYGLELAWNAGAMFVAVAAGWTVVSGSVRPWTLLTLAPLWMVVTAFQAGVGEAMFRGWMLSLLARRRGPYEAVIVQALLFGCLHLLVDTIPPWRS